MGPLLRFELRQQLRQPAFAAAAALFALFGFMLAVGLGRGDVHANSPYLVVEATGFLVLMAFFPLGVFAAAAVLRDREHQLEEVVFATPVTRWRFLASRFAGVLAAGLAVLALGLLGMLAAALTGAVEPERLGPMRALPYAWAFAVVGVPAVGLVAAVLFGIGGLTRSAPACHVASLALYVLYFVAALFTGSPILAASSPSGGTARLAALLDPIGLSAFFEATRTWTLAERNALLPPLAGPLLWNRLLWLAAAAGLLAATYRGYRLRLLPEGGGRPPASGPGAPPPAPGRLVPVTVRPRALPALASAARLEIRLALRGWPFPLLVGCWLVYVVPELWTTVARGEYASGFLPHAGLLATQVLQPLGLFGTIAVVLWASEAFWRERAARLDGILHATPAPGAVFLWAKVAGLAALAGALALAGVAATVAVQAVRAAPSLDLAVTLAAAAAGLVPVLLFAVAAGVVHALAPSRAVGLLLTVALAALMHAGLQAGVEHPLLRFARLPRLAWSDFDGFGDAVGPFLGLGAYWAALLGLVAVPAGLLVRRPTGESLWRRLRALPSLASRGDRRAAALLAVAALGLGGAWLRALSADGWRPRAERLAWAAAYERTYAAVAAEPQPRVAAVEARLDLEPEARAYRARGTLRLVNDGPAPIPRLHVTVVRRAAVHALAVERGRAGPVDARFGVHPFELDPPLGPGESVALTFDLDHRAGGAAAGESDGDVLEDGSLVLGFRAFPGVGYRASYELDEPSDRRRQGLPARTRGDAVAGDGGPSSPWLEADLTVSTAPGQVAVAPGRLVDRRDEGGRPVFRYRTDAPVHGVLAVASGRYAVTRARHGEVDVELHTHPGHAWNAAAVLEAARRSLEELEARFGPYPHPALRLVEVPSRLEFGGYALPGVVLLTERRVFLVDGRREQAIDLVVRRVAHEVAHQWWGHLVTPAPGEGASLLVEGVTKYAEARVLEAMRGPAQVRSLRAYELDRYLRGRGGEVEPPLVRVEDQPQLYYSKALLAFEALRDLLGEERLDGVLRRFVAEQGGPGRRPSAAALAAALRDAAREEDRALVDDWLGAVVVYDLAVEDARSRRLPGGGWEVTARVRAGRVRLGPGGTEAPLPLAEELTLAVLPAEGGAPLWSGKRKLTSGTQELTFAVEGPPASVVIDPGVLRIGRDRADDAREVVEAP